MRLEYFCDRIRGVHRTLYCVTENVPAFVFDLFHLTFETFSTCEFRKNTGSLFFHSENEKRYTFMNLPEDFQKNWREYFF